MHRTLLAGALVAVMAMAAMGSAVAADAERAPSVHPPPAAANAAAPTADAAVVSKAPSSVDAHDLERGRKLHAALADQKLELEQLRAEVNRLRAVSEMCQAGVDKRMAAATVMPPRSP